MHTAHLDLEDAAAELHAPLFKLNVTGRDKLAYNIFQENYNKAYEIQYIHIEILKK